MVVHFLVCLTVSVVHEVKNAGYHQVHVGINDFVSIDLENGRFTSFIFWPEAPMTTAFVRLTNNTGAEHNHTIYDESGIQISGQSTLFSLEEETNLKIWIIYDQMCPGPVFMYATPFYLSDELGIDKASKPACFFFTNSVTQGNIYIETQPASKNALISMYESTDIDHPMSLCSGTKCKGKIANPTFFKVSDISDSTTIVLEMKLSQKEPENTPCDRVILSSVNSSMFELRGIKSRKSVTTCDESEASNEVFMHIAILLSILMLSLAVIIALKYYSACDPVTRMLDPGRPMVSIHTEDENVLISDEVPESDVISQDHDSNEKDQRF